MSENDTAKKGLTAKKRAAIASLLSAQSQGEAAERAGIAERTLYRWLKDPEFRAALRQAESEALHHATRQLVSEQSESIRTLASLRDDLTMPPQVRRGAARDLLQLSQHFVELRTLEERITALEERLI